MKARTDQKKADVQHLRGIEEIRSHIYGNIVELGNAPQAVLEIAANNNRAH